MEIFLHSDETLKFNMMGNMQISEALSYIFRFHTAQDKKFANQLPGIFPITVMVVIAW